MTMSMFLSMKSKCIKQIHRIGNGIGEAGLEKQSADRQFPEILVACQHYAFSSHVQYLKEKRSITSHSQRKYLCFYNHMWGLSELI